MRLLLAEDDPTLADALSASLRGAGFEVVLAPNGAVAEYLLLNQPFDLGIIDLGLPMVDGLTVLKRAHAAHPEVPLLILTALDSLESRVAGLNAGADDYLTKPFDFTELTARLRALLRRSGGSPAPTIRARGVELDPATREVRKEGALVQLTPKEFALLEYLLRNPNRPLSRAMLMEHVWGIRFDPGTNVVDVFINSLRNKLDPERELILTVRGVGYMVKTPEEGGR